MRKIIILILTVFSCTLAYTQVVHGIVLDQNTHKPVSFAAVYFNGSFVGTYSDNNGYFSLDISNNRSMPMVISALGYYSVTIPDLVPDNYYRVYLKPKIFYPFRVYHWYFIMACLWPFIAHCPRR